MYFPWWADAWWGTITVCSFTYIKLDSYIIHVYLPLNSDLYFVSTNNIVRVQRSLIYDMKLRRIESSKPMHELFKHLAEDMELSANRKSFIRSRYFTIKNTP